MAGITDKETCYEFMKFINMGNRIRHSSNNINIKSE